MLVAAPPPRERAAAGGAGESLRFETVCQCFEALIQPAADRHRRPGLMRKLWDAYGLGRHDLFPLMRLTLPALDTVRPNYRLKARGLAKMYVEILALPDSSEDAQAMLNWKKPSTGFPRNEQGNFPEIVSGIIKHRSPRSRGAITVGMLNAKLDELAAKENHDAKKKVLCDLYAETTAQEQRWILRIILKDMHIGMKEDSVFNLLHPDAKGNEARGYFRGLLK